MASEDRWSSLVDDLTWVAGRLLRNAYKQASGADERKHPTLASVIRGIEGDAAWEARPGQTLLETMRAAIGKLSEQLEQRKPEDKGKKTRVPLSSVGCPERRVAEILYGYADKEVVVRLGSSWEFSYSDYVKAAKQVAGLKDESEVNVKRLTRVIRQDLADKLLEMEERKIKAREQTPARAELSISGIAVPFVPRPSLDEQFTRIWDAQLTEIIWRRTNALCLVGEPGTGKSRYLRELTALTDAVWISAGSAGALSMSLADALEQYDVPVVSLDTLALKHAFGKLLVRPDGPSLVVIDDIPDPHDIDDAFIPQSTQARLVISSRTRPAEDWSPVLRVGDLDSAEAAALIRALLPDTDTPAADALAAALGYRPLAIVQACALVRRSPALSVTGLTRALTRDTATTLKSLPSRRDAALTEVYRLMFAALREQCPDDYWLLPVLAVMPPLYMPIKLLAGPIAKQLTTDPADRDLLYLRARAVIEPLRQFCLLEEDGLGIRLSTLTHNIVRGLLSDEDIMTAMNRYHALTSSDDGIFDLLRAGWSPREVASLRVIDELYFRRVEELIAARGTPTDTEARPVRQGIMLTTDQWSALTEALWERALRVVLVAELLRHPGNQAESASELMQRYSAEFTAIEEIKTGIPGREAWETEFNSFDPDDFMHWLATNKTIDREAWKARLAEDFQTWSRALGEFYVIHRGLLTFMTNPIVETRLGRLDLREIYPLSESQE